MHRHKRTFSRRRLLGSLVIGWPTLDLAAPARATDPSPFLQRLEDVSNELNAVLLQSYAGAPVAARPRLDDLGASRREQVEARLDALTRDPSQISALSRAIDNELARGDVVTTDNWILSRTEGDICFMLVLARGRIDAARGTG